MTYIPPSVNSTSFNCPHCHALASQTWYSIIAKRIKNNGIPLSANLSDEKKEITFEDIKNKEQREKFNETVKKIRLKKPFLDDDVNDFYNCRDVYNINISECYNCKNISIWVFDKLVEPTLSNAPIANPDMPESVKDSYLEAGKVLSLSPRSSAALLRLSIQELCKELGLPGKNLNSDIGKLVERGIDVKIQKALDTVRVIGNNAVHPGNIDMKDDRSTAETLFKLVNLIVDRMISEPKQIDAIYNTLPDGVKSAINQRDDKKNKNN